MSSREQIAAVRRHNAKQIKTIHTIKQMVWQVKDATIMLLQQRGGNTLKDTK